MSQIHLKENAVELKEGHAITNFKYPNLDEENEDFESFMKRMFGEMNLKKIALEFLKKKYLNHAEDLEKNRKYIYYVLVEKNNEFDDLKIPKRELLGMDIVYFLFITDIGPIKQSLVITENMMADWKLKEEDLFEIAKENTPKLFPILLENQNNILEILNHKYEKQLATFDYLYVCTNEHHNMGAISIFYPGEIQKLAEEYKDQEIFIMPATRDYMIILLLNSEKMTDKLEETLRSLYKLTDSKGPMFSENLLYYNRLTQNIEIL